MFKKLDIQHIKDPNQTSRYKTIVSETKYIMDKTTCRLHIVKENSDLENIKKEAS